MTASPVGSMRATSNVGTPSLLSGDTGSPTSASTTAFASACAVPSGASLCAPDAGFEIAGDVVAMPVSTGGSRRMCWMAKKSATPQAATNANGTTKKVTVRLVDEAVMIFIFVHLPIIGSTRVYSLSGNVPTSLRPENAGTNDPLTNQTRIAGRHYVPLWDSWSVCWCRFIRGERQSRTFMGFL